jgi:site-specific DNA-methyltransferase (adenine-specific)
MAESIISRQVLWLHPSNLLPHPSNPRLIYRDDVIEPIAESIKRDGFQECYSLLVRPLGNAYQILSGHTRHKAAVLAGCEKLPCWVRDLDDDQAFLELVKANSQGELSPLEIGIHALKYVEMSEGGRGKKGGLSEYAREIGKAQSTMSELKNAAQVYKVIAQAIGLPVTSLLDKSKHLSHISKTPSQHWQQLTDLLIEKEWSAKQTEVIVSAIKEIDIPEHLHHWLNPEIYIKKTIAEALGGEIRTPRDLANWIGAATKQLEVLPENRKVVVIDNDKEVIEYWDMKSMFLDELPGTAKGDKKPSAQKIEAIAKEILGEAAELDRVHEGWVQARSGDAEREKARLAKHQKELELKAKYAPVGHNLDLRDFAPSVQFHAIITDPPYLLSNGGTTVRSGKEVSVDKNFEDDAAGAITPSQYCQSFFSWLHDGGYFAATCTHHLLYDLHSAAVAAGFEFVQNLIWFKRNSPPLLSADRFKPDYEYISVFKKPGTSYFGYDAIKSGDSQRGATIDIPQCGGSERLGWHDTQKPLELMELLISAYVPVDGLVLDPFAGSGSTAVAAKARSRICHWIEKKPDFFEKAANRIEDTKFSWEG